MGDVDNTQGQNTGSPENAAPETPTTPPDNAGQGEVGQGDGQGAQASGHELNPEVTKAQQAAADARREADALKARLDQIENQVAPPPQVDENQRAFDEYAQKSQVMQQPLSELRNVQAQLMDTRLSVDTTKYPHYNEVRDRVMADVAQMGAIPAPQMNSAMDMLYAKHAQPLVVQQASAKDQQIAALQSQLDQYKQGAQARGIDLGALQQGAAPQQAQAKVPGPGASPDELAAFIDSQRGQ